MGEGANAMFKLPKLHAYGTEYKSDADNHWNECACTDKANVAPHADTNNDEKCDACGYDMPVQVPDTTPGTTPGTTPVTNPDDTSNTPNTPDDPSNENDGLDIGAIVGIVIGSVAAVGVGGFALFWFVIKKKTWAEFLAIFKKK
jgi:hypothetical protein